MWKAYSPVIKKYPRTSLREERRLIAQAKKGSKEKAEELILRHMGFLIFRIHKKTFPVYRERFGEDLFSQAVFVLYQKIETYNLRYRDRKGRFKPVRFSSYIWNRIDRMIIDVLKKEIQNDKLRKQPDWERFDHEDHLYTLPEVKTEGALK